MKEIQPLRGQVTEAAKKDGLDSLIYQQIAPRQSGLEYILEQSCEQHLQLLRAGVQSRMCHEATVIANWCHQVHIHLGLHPVTPGRWLRRLELQD